MTAESDAFEQLNARIERLRQGTGAEVEWNAQIPDPDDRGEMRQVDVLIKNGNLRTGVECRLRDAAQSVMWIEELIGRKQSLNLDGIIGVAVNGFTKLAEKKAKRYGIMLYDFRDLTDAEIASWTGAARVEATFVQFDPLVIVAGVPASRTHELSSDVTFRHSGKDGYAAVMDMVRDDAVAHQGVQRYCPLNPANFETDGVPIGILNVGYIGRTVTVVGDCTAVQAVDAPGTPVLLREVTVQRFEHSVSEVIRRQCNVHFVINVSGIHPPQDSILHELKVTFDSTVTMQGYELIGDRMVRTHATSVMLQVVALP